MIDCNFAQAESPYLFCRPIELEVALVISTYVIVSLNFLFHHISISSSQNLVDFSSVLIKSLILNTYQCELTHFQNTTNAMIRAGCVTVLIIVALRIEPIEFVNKRTSFITFQKAMLYVIHRIF